MFDDPASSHTFELSYDRFTLAEQFSLGGRTKADVEEVLEVRNSKFFSALSPSILLKMSPSIVVLIVLRKLVSWLIEKIGLMEFGEDASMFCGGFIYLVLGNLLIGTSSVSPDE